MYTAADTGAQVGRAGQDKSEMVVPHEFSGLAKLAHLALKLKPKIEDFKIS